MTDPIRIALLGCTGSIGRSTLEVVRRHPERFRIVAMSANRRVDALADLVAEFAPSHVAVADEKVPLPTGANGWARGAEAVADLARLDEADVVVNAVIGAAGLMPTLAALEEGKRVALANKESLVAGGSLVLDVAERTGGEVVPIDSEHSAILQCLAGCDRTTVRRIVLTASGGPFRGRSVDELVDVRPSEALRHPTWDMGAKITIDSATLGNKALEVIEAHVLYGIDYDRIDAVVHPQSIVHSFVEFVDGSLLAQVGDPTMELPIMYALTWPERVEDTRLQGWDPVASSPLTFEAIDHAAFPMFGVGVDAGRRGGVATAAFNAANEVAVAAYLDERIRFPDMADVVADAIMAVGSGVPTTIDDVMRADDEARSVAAEAITNIEKQR
ncbi:MAG TPA: 1-deoxy-D-xylulose-5-phosphate reductoisomerase [Longimicrobiales bacterium]|nr:1-deoxy-D-xylulose-5-phosphate reductoisomerase [Longimicrobiales bacterium]